MHSILNILIQFALIAVPIMLLLFVKARVSSVILRFACAIAVALAAGASGRYLAAECGWQPVLRSGRSLSPMEPEALFWILSGTVFILLLIVIFSCGHAHQDARAMQDGPTLCRSNETLAATQAPEPEDALNGRKMMFWIMTTIYGLALLVWPFVAFIGLFIFGDKRGHQVFNTVMAVSIWIYPLLFITGCRWGHYRRNRTSIGVILKTSVSLLSAIWYFLLPGGVSLVWQLLTEEKVNIAELESQRNTLNEKLNPIYQTKIDSINGRNPEQDASLAIRQGTPAFLPSTPGGDFFPGLENSAEQRRMAAENGRLIIKSGFLSELEKQLGDDPSHSIKADPYFSPTYKQYLSAKFAYMEKYNRAILLHQNRAKK